MNVDSLTRLGLYSGFYLFTLVLSNLLNEINNWATPLMFYVVGFTILGWFVKLYTENRGDFLHKETMLIISIIFLVTGIITSFEI